MVKQKQMTKGIKQDFKNGGTQEEHQNNCICLDDFTKPNPRQEA